MSGSFRWWPFILLIACINFMNLTTARSASRAWRSACARSGAPGRHRRAFYGESVLLVFAALALAGPWPSRHGAGAENLDLPKPSGSHRPG
jgi:hypothetical protein